ncbi:MAG: peptidase C60 sortase A and B [Candidatus Gottesmanbacteria bacterium GW2011_GWA2_43_14]|uniref:Peptidase C60 sortase A and B n=1 Tax=Candidatus Gottesmanbacteria bacterium GW2011_GWA2_43_14 TaxID=1618443 RepID=A0A0G1DKH1_9BACT|nr:MAG: peptidase C60 sortase A and B [Candidatus Gottesmanbacteria bacterium GW2011_GWA2_43_14]
MKKLLLTPFLISGLFIGLNLTSAAERPLIKNTAGYVLRPQEIEIPDLKIKTEIEWVAEDTDGNMASPEDTNRVAWYMDGFLPGEKGNMVIAGHRDSKSGPAVFYELEKLDTGDTVKLKDIKGTVYVYRVTDEKVYSDENFPVKEIFGRSDRKKLNLITCKGSFDKSLQQYSHRVVVEAELSYSYWSGFL